MNGYAAVFDARAIKSADPVTRDDAGNVVPLSQRFNPQQDDIRFSPTREMPDILKSLRMTVPYFKTPNGDYRLNIRTGAAIDTLTAGGNGAARLTTINLDEGASALAGASGIAIRNNVGNSIVNMNAGSSITDSPWVTSWARPGAVAAAAANAATRDRVIAARVNRRNGRGYRGYTVRRPP